MRDADFHEVVKGTLAQRVGYHCSNPDCRALTSGPQVDPSKSLNIGVAAHISAASSGGPRYDHTLSTEARQSITNGIWLCQDCAKLADNDPLRFTLEVLKGWKATAEAETLNLIGKTLLGSGDWPPTGPHHVHFQEDLELEINPRFGFSFLYPKNWDRQDPENSDGNSYKHPKNSRIEIRAWGGYAVVSQTLDEWVSWMMERETQKPGFQILRNTESGRHVYYYRQTEKGVIKSREQIRGRRVVFRYEESAEAFTAMQVSTQFGNAQFAIRCEAPSGKYPGYEDLFIVLGQSLRVLGEHPDMVFPAPVATRSDSR